MTPKLLASFSPALGVTLLAVGIAPPLSAAQADGTVSAWTKISDTSGGFEGVLDDNDRFSSSVALLQDLDGDGVRELAVGARLDDDGGMDAGCVWVLFRNADGSIRAHRKISATSGDLPGEIDALDRFGVALGNLPDLDGDGIEELAIGSRLDDDGGLDRGAVYIVFPDADGSVRSYQKISQTRGGFGGVLGDQDQWGSAVAWLGDLDGDGFGELAVGGPENDRGGPNTGCVWILSLDATGFVVDERLLASGIGGLPLLDPQDRFGVSASPAGDRDGDGVADLFVGALMDDTGVNNAGALYLLLLNSDGSVREAILYGNGVNGLGDVLAEDDNLGRSVLGLGDVDGDGVRDLAGGAYVRDGDGVDRGAFFVFFLNADHSVKAWVEVGDGVGGFGAPLDDGDRIAISLASRGDLDGDGRIDVVSGAMRDDDGGMDRGAVYQLDLFGAVQAAVVTRSGAGGNPACASSLGAPRLGTDWTVALESDGTGTLLAGSAASLAGLATGFGELLIDPTPGLLVASLVAPLDGVATHAIPVPFDLSLEGFSVFTQGVELGVGAGVGVSLCNALDARLGY